MKRFLLVAALLTGTFLDTVHAQVDYAGGAFYRQPYKMRNSGSFDASSNVVSIGYGLRNYTGYSEWFGTSNSGGLGPFYLKYEHGVLDEFGVGGYLATAGSYRTGNNAKWRNLAVSIGVLGYYHFNKLIEWERFDLYVGAGMGARVVTFSNDQGNKNDDAEILPVPLIKAGARWYFTPVVSAYLESGYDNMSDFNFGLSFRF